MKIWILSLFSNYLNIKNQYAAYALEVGPEQLRLENCVRSMADIFGRLDVRNHGFKKTGLSLFQSEPAKETEQVMNLKSFSKKCMLILYVDIGFGFDVGIDIVLIC